MFQTFSHAQHVAEQASLGNQRAGEDRHDGESEWQPAQAMVEQESAPAGNDDYDAQG